MFLILTRLNFSLNKSERLCSRKAFEILLKGSKVKFCFPLRVLWSVTDYPQEFPVQVAFSVPKRRFKRANKRNLLKRRLREAYRLNKNPLYDVLTQKGLRIQVLFVYIGTEVLTYHEIEPKLSTIIQQIMADVEKASK